MINLFLFHFSLVFRVYCRLSICKVLFLTSFPSFLAFCKSFFDCLFVCLFFCVSLFLCVHICLFLSLSLCCYFMDSLSSFLVLSLVSVRQLPPQGTLGKSRGALTAEHSPVHYAVSWYLYQMVTHYMLHTHDGKYIFSDKNIRFVPAFELIKSLLKVK